MFYLQKVDPNESGSLDRFSIARWYVDREVYVDSSEESGRLVGWSARSSLLMFSEQYF